MALAISLLSCVAILLGLLPVKILVGVIPSHHKLTLLLVSKLRHIWRLKSFLHLITSYVPILSRHPLILLVPSLDGGGKPLRNQISELLLDFRTLYLMEYQWGCIHPLASWRFQLLLSRNTPTFLSFWWEFRFLLDFSYTISKDIPSYSFCCIAVDSC